MYSSATQTAQIHRIKKVEEYYGNLDEHAETGTYGKIISSLQYSASDERTNKPNPSKIKFEGNIRNNLQSYKNAVVRYNKFLNDKEFNKSSTENITPSQNNDTSFENTDTNQQKFSLERDMQAALRKNIHSLDTNLKIIDDGAERAVNSGLIDITCEDDSSLVVIELKSGKADSRSIGQILGYMGDLNEEEGGRPVKGILVAHDFDKRVIAAAKVVPTLKLKKYSIEFKFIDEE
jgi:hypothetical protein